VGVSNPVWFNSYRRRPRTGPTPEGSNVRFEQLKTPPTFHPPVRGGSSSSNTTNIQPLRGCPLRGESQSSVLCYKYFTLRGEGRPCRILTNIQAKLRQPPFIPSHTQLPDSGAVHVRDYSE